MGTNSYLQFPEDDGMKKFGLCKTLLVRRETIHIKHILTEVFVRKTVPILEVLGALQKDLMWFMEFTTNRVRCIYNINRDYRGSFKSITDQTQNQFFPYLGLLSPLNTVVALDFDGTITKKNFHPFYTRLVENHNTVVCTANPTVTNDYFVKHGLPLPKKIYANQGKIKKIICLVELQRKHDFVFFIDNEKEYLDYAWIFGIKTYLWASNRIGYYTRKTK